MSMTQSQKLYEHLCKAGLLKGEKTPEASKTLEARVSMLEGKCITVVMRTYSWMKTQKLTTEIIQPLAERKAAPERAKQTDDG